MTKYYLTGGLFFYGNADFFAAPGGKFLNNTAGMGAAVLLAGGVSQGGSWPSMNFSDGTVMQQNTAVGISTDPGGEGAITVMGGMFISVCIEVLLCSPHFTYRTFLNRTFALPFFPPQEFLPWGRIPISLRTRRST